MVGIPSDDSQAARRQAVLLAADAEAEEAMACLRDCVGKGVEPLSVAFAMAKEHRNTCSDSQDLLVAGLLLRIHKAEPEESHVSHH